MTTARKMVDSGVEWIGEIPEDWEAVRLKDVTDVNPKVKMPSHGEVSFIPMECLKFGKVSLEQKISVDNPGSYTKFQDGDILIAKVTPCFENGKIAVAEKLIEGMGLGSSEITPLRPNGILPTYLMRVMQSPTFVATGVATMNGTAGLQRVSTSFWKDTPIPLPPLPEQQAIANFLDHHVSLIDRERELIAQKIDLLKEKRKALIFECVTGKRVIVEAQHLAGMEDWSDVVGSGEYVAIPRHKKGDPFIKEGGLVDSGVEWIGEVPEGWGLGALSSLISVSSGKNINSLLVFEKKSEEKKTPVWGSNGIRGYTDKSTHSKGKILVGRVGSVGAVNESSGEFWATDNVLVVSTTQELQRYIKYLLSVIDFDSIISGTAQPLLTGGNLLKVRIPTTAPPQCVAIANFLDNNISLIDRERELIDQKITLLEEKRRALIFEAVTGKIDIS